MKKSIALLVVIASIACGVWIYLKHRQKPPTKSAVVAYLLIEPAGPTEWLKKHRLTLKWRGEEITLPAAFKMEIAQGKEEKKGKTGGFGASPGLNNTIQLGQKEARVVVSPAADLYFTTDFPPLIHSVDNGDVLKSECLSRLLVGPPDFLQSYSGPDLSEDEYRKRLEVYGPIRTVRDD